jgi:hypothetical protein
MTDKSIEVFQDRHRKSHALASSIRAAVLTQVHGPWRHDLEREEDIRNHASDGEDVIVPVREAFDDVDESGLPQTNFLRVSCKAGWARSRRSPAPPVGFVVGFE